MQVTLFKALQSIKIDDDTATAVVDDLEDYMKGRMEDAVKPLSDQIAGLRNQLSLFGVLIFFVGFMIAAGPSIAKLVP